MFGSLDFHVAGQLQKPGLQAVLDMIGAADCSKLLDCAMPWRNDRGIKMVINKFFRANGRFVVELNFDLAIELKIVRLLIVDTFLAPNRFRRLVPGCGVHGDIDIFKDTFVVFETEVRFRVHCK